MMTSEQSRKILCMLLLVIFQHISSTLTPDRDTRTFSVCQSQACVARAARMRRMMDDSADPCADFWQYACGEWRSLKIDSSSPLLEMKRVVETELLGLLSSEQRHYDPPVVQMTKRFYRSCTNHARLRRLGDTRLLEVLDSVFHGDHFPEDITSRLLALEVLGVSPVLGVDVTVNTYDTSHYIMRILQPSMNLKRYRHADALQKYTRLVVTSLRWTAPQGEGRWEERGEQVVRLEAQLAKAKNSSQKEWKADSQYQLLNLSTLQARYPDLDWRRFFQGLFKIHRVPFAVQADLLLQTAADSYLDQLFPLLRRTDPRTLRDFLLWSSVRHLIPFTMGRLWQLANTFASNVAPVRGSRRKYLCSMMTRDHLPDVVGHMYATAFTSHRHIHMAKHIVAEMVEAIKLAVRETHWLSDTAKKNTVQKLSAMRMEVGTPFQYLNVSVLGHKYTGIRVTSIDFLLNHLRLYRHESQWSLQRLLQPVRHVDWQDASQTNAFYLYPYNAIVIPAAMLRSPLFTLGLPDSLNYGSLGWVVAHEVSHSLDSRGRRHDPNGNLRPWWGQEDVAQYELRADCFAEFFSRFRYSRVNASVNGRNTLAENIADSVGMSAAYRAFRQHGDRYKAGLPGLSHLTPSQLFFLAFAQNWCSTNPSASSLWCSLRTDSHSPNLVRVIGTLSNSRDFARAFGCPLRSRMNPPEKCLLLE